MTDVRQSPQFASFMQDIGWRIQRIASEYIFMRNFPLFGYFAKIPRSETVISPQELLLLKKKNRIFRLKISPNLTVDNKKCQKYRQKLITSGFQVENSPFNPTTTIQIDLTKKEEEIFADFSQAKRRGVRRALKNKITVKETSDFRSFIKIRQKQYAPMGFLITNEMEKLWQNFYPQNASLLLAYLQPQNIPLSGILLLFYNQIAYYWFASSLPLGKKLFTPTFLVWHALKVAKKKGCRIFDFEGIYDSRFPKASESWKGFTKFKEGFGGKKIIYMENYKC